MKYRLMLLVLLAAAAATLLARPGIGEERRKIEIKPALLVIDMQNIWLPRMEEKQGGSAQDTINELIALFREYRRPVIRIYHTDPRLGPDPATESFEFLDSIDIRNDDLQIIKNHSSAFTDTDLDKILREKECNAVFLCGYSATGCVLATYYGAMDRNFTAVMVEGALLSHNASYTAVIEDICLSMTIAEVRKTLLNPFL